MCDVDYVRSIVNNGLSKNDAVRLFVECDFRVLAKVANEITEKVTGNSVTFVNNVVINYSNICVAQCPICAFYRPPKHPEAYVRSPQEIINAVREARARYGVDELHINGGFNPDLTIEYFEEVFSGVKRAVPEIIIKGPTAAEVDFYARVWRMSSREVLERLKVAGLDVLSGGGAEILSEDVRKIITPYKFDANTWLRIQKEAHEVGLHTNATMLYGHIEQPHHIVEHVMAIKRLQEETGGVLMFIPIKFVPWNTRLLKDGIVKGPAPPEYDIKVIAISRLILGSTIRRIGAYWASTGKRLASTLLLSGANDLVGTMINEQVMKQAGLREYTTIEELASIAREVGRRPYLRDTLHRKLIEVKP
ncbi:MAG: CofH family radical SAM protein [Vulcanisaeta sp.]|nr:CofH family radical SAM protein [Vulcanisaeta sp.]